MAIIDERDAPAVTSQVARGEASGRTRAYNQRIETHDLSVRYSEPSKLDCPNNTMHPIILGLFDDASSAADAARALHAAGVRREQLSVVARNHDEEGTLAEQMDATPGAEVEESRPAARLGELSGLVLAAIAFVMPGIGPIVAAGPLSAGLGEAAGHVAGGIASILSSAGVDPSRASALQEQVERGAILLAVHATEPSLRATSSADIREILRTTGARDVQVVNWRE
jgi:hypothetical protein